MTNTPFKSDMAISKGNEEFQAKLEQLEKQEQFHRQTLADILTFSTRLTRNLDLKSLYRESNSLSKNILKLDYSTLMLLSEDRNSLVIRDAIGFPSSMVDTFSLLEGQGLSTYVVKEKKAAVVPDFQTEERFEVPTVVFKEKIISALAVPMMIMDEVFGIMIGHTRTRRNFSPEEIDLYQSIANQSAVAIKNVMNYESLQDSEKRFRTLIERAGDAIYLADMDGRLVDVNQTACQALGYSREELLNMTVFEIDPLTLEAPPQESLWPNLSDGSYATITSQHRRKDGSLFPVEIRIGLLPLHNETYVLGFARDVSDREKAEKERQKLQDQLAQAQKMESIGTLAGGIAHDFNNILTPILGYLDLALMHVTETPRLMNDLRQLQNAAERAREMVQQILTFSRNDSKSISCLHPVSVVKEALELLRVSIPKTIEIRQDIDPRCGAILASPTQIHQILMNLSTNAYHAMRETGGVLLVSLKPLEISERDSYSNVKLAPGHYLRLEVRDTGCGMDQVTLERIFEPYFTTKDTGEGTGMGLAVVHGIVTSFGGKIDVDSEPGKGTGIRIYLPVVSEDKTESEEQPGLSLATGTERIMFVDDEISIGSVVSGMLENLGYSVHIFTDSIRALEYFTAQSDSFDLVITDMTMPGMTGDKLSKAIMSIRPDMPIIICSGFSDLIDRKAAKALGIRDYVTKPVAIRTFARTIRDVLDQKNG